MSNKNKSTLVPKLRFSEFQDARGWEKNALSSVATVVMGSSPKSEFYNEDHDGLPLLQGNADIKNRLSAPRIFTSEITKECQIGEILMSVRAPVGSVAKSIHHACIGRGIAAIQSKELKSQEFLYQWLISYEPRWGSISQGGTFDAINSDDLKGVGLAIPSPDEQQKIADCLSSLDELITAQARKVDALKTHKKGLMQQLFPREGETQPRLRFPEFQNTGEWEEVTLGDIAEIKLGKMLDKKKHTTGHLLPYLNNLAVRWNEVNTSDLPKMYFNDRELDRFGLRAGDVVVCEGGEPGRAAVWDGRLPDLKFQKAIHRVRFSVPFEPKVLVLHLENLAGTTAFEMLFTGGGIKHLTGETFSRLKIPLIPHAEQQRIADCLTSLDTLITTANQELETLKTHKKGLMQQLFPSVEAVEA